MSQTTLNPGSIVIEENEFESFGGFPNQLYLISVGDGMYAANNATLPDGQNLNGLASFPDREEALTYMGLLAGLSGDIVPKTFEEARDIAKSKPRLSCIFLFAHSKIVDVHYVR